MWSTNEYVVITWTDDWVSTVECLLVCIRIASLAQDGRRSDLSDHKGSNRMSLLAEVVWTSAAP